MERIDYPDLVCANETEPDCGPATIYDEGREARAPAFYCEPCAISFGYDPHATEGEHDALRMALECIASSSSDPEAVRVASEAIKGMPTSYDRALTPDTNVERAEDHRRWGTRTGRRVSEGPNLQELPYPDHGQAGRAIDYIKARLDDPTQCIRATCTDPVRPGPGKVLCYRHAGEPSERGMRR